ncbi:Ig-like domain-containing protein [uncultured Shewanella sp.]|uniref:beta strand repeat-containing protein n=1 Tax=uncultured Shewanella sp. TaxID=173975 RepID=UPI00261087EC|nr:Ig-like domain-containing protein [uncultured Shewanella sp.]
MLLKNIVFIVFIVFIVLLSGCGDAKNDNTDTIIAIQITPTTISQYGTSELTLQVGNTQAFTATAVYYNGDVIDITSSVIWSSQAPSLLSINSSGLATAIAVGSTTVSATKDGISSNNISVTISDAGLTAIQITPASITLNQGNSLQLTAIGTYSDGSSADITSSVSWLSDNMSTATVTPAGLLTAEATGSTFVSATQDGISSNDSSVTVSDATLTAIQITPASVILNQGNSQQLAATGTYSDGSTADITNSVSWVSYDTSVATVSTAGLITGVATGSATVSATQDGISSSDSSVTVSDATLTAIQITPASVTLNKGNRQQLTAIGTYSDSTTGDITSAVSWLSDDMSVATVTPEGLLIGEATGSTTVSATLDSISSNDSSVTVSAAELTTIQITPASVTLSKGNTQELIATGTYSDSTTAVITSSVSWVSDDTSVATVSTAGLLSGVTTGSATVSATLDNISSNDSSVTVSDATLTAIQITPASVTLYNGNTQELIATGTYSDGTTADITSAVSWHSDDMSVVTVTPAGLLTGEATGSATVSATLDSISSNDSSVTVSDATLTAIQITPASVTLSKGNTQELIATGTYSDSTTAVITSAVSWVSDDTSVATVSTEGLITAVAVGSVTVSATLDSISSNDSSVTVSAATLTDIQITPASVTLSKGNTQELIAKGTYSDGTTEVITSAVSWLSNDMSVATVTPAGLLTAESVGSATVSAILDSISSNDSSVTVSAATLTAIQITPASVTLSKGNTQELIATGTYSDGTSSDISNAVSWVSDDTSVATVSITGLVTAVATGSATVSATLDTISSNDSSVTVSAATLTDIQITPASVILNKGNTQPLTATGTYSDGTSVEITNSVSWGSDDMSVATVTTAGLLSAEAVGSTQVSATLDGISSNDSSVTVSAATLTDIQITPVSVILNKGRIQQLTATGTYSDGTSSDISNAVSWVSDDTSVATVTTIGLVTGVSVGSATVSATLDSISGNSSVTVSAATLAAIQITPASVTLNRANSEQLTATGTYSDDTTADITNLVSWLSDNTSTATVTTAGQVTGVSVGSTQVSATLDSISSNDSSVTVNNAELISIKVTPSTFTLTKGTDNYSQQLTATGTYSDGNKDEITTSVTWVSANYYIVRFTGAGLATVSLNTGKTYVYVTKDGVTSTSSSATVE